MNVAPSSLSSAGFNEKNVIVSVATSNEWGYNLVMNIPNTNLVSKEDSSNIIPTLAPKDGGYTCTIQTAATCDFTVNHWGYKINTNTTTQTATNYLPIPTTINLNSLDTVTTGDTTSISFGSRINASQTPGTYQSTITFAVTANPDPTPVMQNMTASTLASLLPTSGSTATVKDERDGTKYTIGKLADGNYWMLDNLALDLINSTILNNITTSNTNASEASLISLKSGNRSAGNQYATAGASSWTSSYSYSVPLSSAVNKDQTQPVAMGQTSVTGKIGVYYNFCAASAGSYCYGNGTSSGSPSGNATEDICPKGWRLPTGGSSSGEYQALYAAYSSNDTNFVLALKASLSGYFNEGSVSSKGEYGSFWSSTYYGSTGMYRLFVYPSSIILQKNGNRPNGVSVRCIYNGPTMQNITSVELAELMPNDGDSTTLVDGRDGKKYSVTNIGGFYYMTTNLDLAGKTTLTPADSNVVSNYVLPASSIDFSTNRQQYVYNTNTTKCVNNSPCYSYYSYAAATAGTGASIGTDGQNATSDICPKGWRLLSSAEYDTLINTNFAALSLFNSGHYMNGSYSTDIGGSYWTSTVDDSNFAYRIASGQIASSNKRIGAAVRCVAK